VNFLRQGFRKLSSDGQTDKQSDRHDRNYIHAASQVVKILYKLQGAHQMTIDYFVWTTTMLILSLALPEFSLRGSALIGMVSFSGWHTKEIGASPESLDLSSENGTHTQMDRLC